MKCKDGKMPTGMSCIFGLTEDGSQVAIGFKDGEMEIFKAMTFEQWDQIVSDIDVAIREIEG